MWASSNNKLSLKELVWLGFNYIVAVSFVITFGGETGIVTNLGFYIFPLIFICIVVAGGSGLAFAKCSHHFAKINGSSYVYVRANFGRFAGWIIGFLQYCCLPIAGITFIFTMLTANLKSIPFHPFGSNELLQDFYYNLIGMIIFFFSSLSICFGLKFFKWAFNSTLAVQWSINLVAIFVALIIFVESGFQIFYSNLQATLSSAINLSFGNFLSSFNEFIFFFLGFEIYSTITKNIKNPQETIAKSIMWVMVLAGLFYLTTTFLIIGSVNFFDTADHRNPLNEIVIKKLGAIGVALLVISMVALKINAVQGASLYSGACLEPLAVEGYISHKLTYLGKDNLPIRASLFNVFITLIVSAVFLFIPFFYGANVTPKDVFGFIGIVSIIIHVMVLLSTFKMTIRRIVYLRKWEIFWLIFSLIFLIAAGVWFFVDLLRDWHVANLLTLLILVSLLLFSGIWYVFYYLPIYRARLKKNPQLQVDLDRFFILNHQEKTR